MECEWDDAWGDVSCEEGAKTEKNPGDDVTLEVENLPGRDTEDTVASTCSGGVVGSLTGPERPALARSRAS